MEAFGERTDFNYIKIILSESSRHTNLYYQFKYFIYVFSSRKLILVVNCERHFYCCYISTVGVTGNSREPVWSSVYGIQRIPDLSKGRSPGTILKFYCQVVLTADDEMHGHLERKFRFKRCQSKWRSIGSLEDCSPPRQGVSARNWSFYRKWSRN